ncbi:40S ribosomal protein mrp10 [Microsporum canis]
MPPKSAARAGTIRLQSLPRLKVKSPMKYDQNPCLAAMTAVLNCWGATGYSIQGCLALEQQLRLCTDSNLTIVPFANSLPKSNGKTPSTTILPECSV